MIQHGEIDHLELHNRISNAEILFAGNLKLKIYGRLNCASGKRMLKANRVFFNTEAEALALQFRPCGHCMKSAYMKWKNATT